MDTVELLFERLCGRALALNLRVQEKPKVFLRRSLPASELSAQLEGAEEVTTEDSERELSIHNTPFGAYLGNHAVLVSYLGVDVNAVRDIYCHHQQRAAILRAWLPAEYSEDLNLFLVGPMGSERDPKWNEISMGIERDELVCRKFVWLPPVPEECEDSLVQFLSRTFLARPWKDDTGTNEVEMDPFTRIAHRFEGNGIPKSTVSAWFDILEEPEVDGSELVDKLLKIMEQ